MTLNQKIFKLSGTEFKLLMKYGSRVHNFKAREAIYFKYKTIKKELPNLLEQGDFEGVINIVTENKLPLKKIRTLKPEKAIPLVLSVYDQLKRIVEIEKDYLTSTPDPDLQAAGIEQLNEVGDLNTTDAVAQRYGYKIEEVEDKPYHFVFDLQRKMKLEADIQKELIRIQKEKSKRKNRF